MVFDLVTGFFLNKLLVYCIDIIAIVLAFIVYRDNPRRAVNKIYLLMTVLMMMWVNFAYIPRIMGQYNHNFGLLSLRIAWFATPLFFALLYLFTVYLVEKNKEYKTLSKVILLSGATLSFVSGFTGLVVSDFIFIGNTVRIVYGQLMLPFLGVISFMIFATLISVFKDKIFIKNKNIKYFLTGLFIFYIFNAIFNILLPVFLDISRFYFFGDYSTLILLSLTAYAIIRHQLFNIKIVATELLTFAIWIAILIELLLAEGWREKLLEAGLFVFVIIFGILLIRSVRKEVAQREKLEMITKELESANEKLKELDDLKTDFISIASHQLRTPLTAIKGYTSMIMEGSYGEVSDKVKETIGKVFQSAQRLIYIVNDLLDISRIEQGRFTIALEPIKVTNVLKDVVEELQQNAKTKNLTLELEVAQANREVTASADFNKIRQVFLNVIDNAIKYTNEGYVRVSVERRASDVLVSVKDSGLGISEASMKNLFQKFSRAKGVTKLHTDGSGLGLFIVKKIMEAHGGNVWAESEGEGKGSQFYVSIPLSH